MQSAMRPGVAAGGPRFMWHYVTSSRHLPHTVSHEPLRRLESATSAVSFRRQVLANAHAAATAGAEAPLYVTAPYMLLFNAAVRALVVYSVQCRGRCR